MAANSIEKTMQPTDLKGMGLGDPNIEIEIKDPEKVTVGIGDMEIEIEPGKETDENFDANLAEEILYLKTY